MITRKKSKLTSLFFSLLSFLLCVVVAPAKAQLPLYVLTQSTSPNRAGDVKGLPTKSIRAAQGASAVITFSEFAVGTSISTQYQNIGITFGGSGPFITTDGANPTSPVLSGTPRGGPHHRQ